MSVEFEHVAVAKVLGVSELVRTLLTYDCAAKSLLRGLQDFNFLQVPEPVPWRV